MYKMCVNSEKSAILDKPPMICQKQLIPVWFNLLYKQVLVTGNYEFLSITVSK